MSEDIYVFSDHEAAEIFAARYPDATVEEEPLLDMKFSIDTAPETV
jgi:hypothetical protein